MRTIKTTLEYDGTHFAGWQVQPEQRTVQGELEIALRTLTEESIRVTGSGRTDAGVHALGQVAHFQTQRDLPLSAFKEGLNRYLPEDMRILSAEKVAPEFNARRDARRRTYRYIFSRNPGVMDRHFSWYPKCELNVPLLQDASACLHGEHDFSAFSKKNQDIDNYFSEVYETLWESSDTKIFFEISASRFFHNMIRILLGTMIRLNNNKINMLDLKNVLDSKDRRRAGPTIPPQGLFLVRVDY